MSEIENFIQRARERYAAQAAEGAFALQAALQQGTDAARGEVHQLEADGFTRDQACAIVARMFGWSPPIEEVE